MTNSAKRDMDEFVRRWREASQGMLPIEQVKLYLDRVADLTAEERAEFELILEATNPRKDLVSAAP